MPSPAPLDRPFGPASAPDQGPWAELTAELDRWAALRWTATFWWRDDDAARPTPALDRLLDLAAGHGVPLSVAVVPAVADPALAARLDAVPGTTVLQHGWAHRDHSGPGARSIELSDSRDPDLVAAELASGRRRLEELFGDRFLPVLTPPWNRMGEGIGARLPGLGLRGLSLFGPRPAGGAGSARQNTHADIIDWRGGRSFVGTREALAAVIRHLEARRTGTADPAEATGLLTHHLDHDAACWSFLDRFLGRVRGHAATAWPTAASLFGLA